MGISKNELESFAGRKRIYPLPIFSCAKTTACVMSHAFIVVVVIMVVERIYTVICVESVMPVVKIKSVVLVV